MRRRSPLPPITRVAVLAYAISGFALTFGFFACYVIFLGNLPNPSNPWLTPTVDVGPAVPPALAALWDVGLVALFGLQHSAMARPVFKAWWKRRIPEGLERSTYVMAAVAAGFIMLIFWKPIPIVIWDLGGAPASALWTAFALGWIVLLAAAINFDLLELLGVRHAWAWVNGQEPPPRTFKQTGLYAIVPHPMYVGVLLGIWATPLMTVGHALMGAAMTAYLFIGKYFEERDLRRTFASAYAPPARARTFAEPRTIRPRS
jgi:protein-S-isoprenylcysteine O-methyltransferase Ste14